ncbi:hypothetical protein BN946_scf184927.g5 [Trametes cinnabarina]|uniref:Uncharacterized protein n=1 Tax=Pycnoporus cinnabarinus TaxID=5643 RepID=A0A060SL78_PYCCI|nr:hypothetical protein BN946_scf184927.g5 [Trametes cinnabarina]
MPRAYAYLSAPTGPGSLDTDTASRWTHPQLSAGVYEDIPRHYEDYPNVQWWYKQDWCASKNSRIKDFGRLVQRGAKPEQLDSLATSLASTAANNAHLLVEAPYTIPVPQHTTSAFPSLSTTKRPLDDVDTTSDIPSKRLHQSPLAYEPQPCPLQTQAREMLPEIEAIPLGDEPSPWAPGNDHACSPGDDAQRQKVPREQPQDPHLLTPCMSAASHAQCTHPPQLTLNHSAATVIDDAAAPETSPVQQLEDSFTQGAALSCLAKVPDLFADLIPTTAVKSSETAANKDLRTMPSVQGQASMPLSGTSKTVDRSCKVNGKMAAVWPLAPGAESLKDRCACVWARQPDNLTKTQEDFNIWYKHTGLYKKKASGLITMHATYSLQY